MLSHGHTLIRSRAARMVDRGASAVEYGLLIAGIAALVVVVIFLLGDQIQAAFDGTAECISQASAATC